jgi:hypothetical protein
MMCGNTFFMCNKLEFLVIWVKAMYSTALKANTETMTAKLNEKIMNNSEPITDVIIKANSDMGSPMITARLRIFL